MYSDSQLFLIYKDWTRTLAIRETWLWENVLHVKRYYKQWIALIIVFPLGKYEQTILSN